MSTTLTTEGIIEASVAFTYFTFAIGVLVHHTNSLHNHVGNKSFTWQYLKSQPTLLFAYALLASGLLLASNMFIGTVIGFTSPSWCPIQPYISSTTYIIFKLFLYLVLVARTWKTFNCTSVAILRYNPNKLKIYSAILILWTIGNIFAMLFTLKYTINDSYPRCISITNKWSIISMCLLDFFSGITNMILFISPFYKLSKMTDIDADIKNVAVKQTILAIIAMCTTMIVLILIGAIGFPKIFSGIDAIISTLCIVWMHKWHSSFVAKLCCCCVKHYTPDDVKHLKAVQKEQKTKSGGNDCKVDMNTSSVVKTSVNESSGGTVTVSIAKSNETQTASV